jgi:hypothetical protein
VKGHEPTAVEGTAASWSAVDGSGPASAKVVAIDVSSPADSHRDGH